MSWRTITCICLLLGGWMIASLCAVIIFLGAISICEDIRLISQVLSFPKPISLLCIYLGSFGALLGYFVFSIGEGLEAKNQNNAWTEAVKFAWHKMPRLSLASVMVVTTIVAVSLAVLMQLTRLS